MEKKCESCGMPMTKSEDFGNKDINNKYCRFCTDEAGNLKDFETKYEETVQFVISRMNVKRAAAEAIAKDTMSKQPAWTSYFKG